MTRRFFFRILGLAAVTAPATGALVPEKLAAVRHWWIPTQMWEQEFDYGNRLGIAMEFRNVLTGARVRNAIRFRWRQSTAYVEARQSARAYLRTWADELPPWHRGDYVVPWASDETVSPWLDRIG